MAMAAILIGVGAIVVAALIYFASEEKRKRERQADLDRIEAAEKENERRRLDSEIEERVQRVVDNYRDLALSLKSSNLDGLLRAGVLSLENSSEVEEVCRRIEQQGLTPGIPSAYKPELEAADLMHFFQLLQENPKMARTDSGVRRLATTAKRMENA